MGTPQQRALLALLLLNANEVVIDASYEGEWELPVIGVVSAPTAVLLRPDGYVAWVGEGAQAGLRDALATWFGPPTRAC